MTGAPQDRAFLGRGWAFPPALTADGDIAMASADEDVRQAVLLIVETALGERLMRPRFGTPIRTLVFEPIGATTAALLRHHVEEALIRWEPRIDRIDVASTAAARAGRIDLTVTYRVRETNTFYNLVYPFYLQEGEREERPA